MTINWTTDKVSWAFRFIVEHYSRMMPNHEHVIDSEDKADITYVCSPSHFKTVKPDKSTILHIDSNRWYERVL